MNKPLHCQVAHSFSNLVTHTEALLSSIRNLSVLLGKTQTNITCATVRLEYLILLRFFSEVEIFSVVSDIVKYTAT